MQYAKPRPMDPRQPADAEEQLFERLHAALEEEEDDTDDDHPAHPVSSGPLVLGFFDSSWPQPFENSQRMWSYDRTVELDKPMLAVRWKSIGFYALVGESAITFRERVTKESICAALERIREQNPWRVRQKRQGALRPRGD
jgi:hypothetical protein